ncbi:MAG: UDP-galactopyranose mutase [Solobacterium sp.]|nr:UDP-galactopyranose mutase [Solobacterium sp.]MDY5402593.1 UDP-galactopyranose mutase [Erysipelotrichaceae bacterium]
MKDVIIIGAGFAGATVANVLANRGKNVLIIDKRDHIGGNAYDYMEEDILIHKYGPHIFHTNSKEVFDYLSNFTEWYKYEHKVLGHVDNKLVPIPFNFKSIEECLPEKAEELIELLKNNYGEGKKVPIMELLSNENEDIRYLANYIYEHVFKYYTMKQWDMKVEELDSAVSARVPVNTSYDDRYFNDAYQYMPKEGYTKLIEKMLDNEHIEVLLNTNVTDILKLDDGTIYYNGVSFNGDVYYTGALDELFEYKHGELPYRSLDLILERLNKTFQDAATENYPENDVKFTRITEYKHFMEVEPKGVTYIHTEYPFPYRRNGEVGNVPYYPIIKDENQALYETYVKEASKYPKLHLIGRLAEYKYYNMDAIVLKALEMCKD